MDPEDDEICCICLTNFKEHEGHLEFLPCAHKFGSTCFEKLIQQVDECPLCKQPFRERRTTASPEIREIRTVMEFARSLSSIFSPRNSLTVVNGRIVHFDSESEIENHSEVATSDSEESVEFESDSDEEETDDDSDENQENESSEEEEEETDDIDDFTDENQENESSEEEENDENQENESSEEESE